MLLLGLSGSGKSPLGEFLSQHGLLGRSVRHLDFGSALCSAVTDPFSRYIDSQRAFDCDAYAVSCRLRDNIGRDREGRQDDDAKLVKKNMRSITTRHDRFDLYSRIGGKIHRLSIGAQTTAEESFLELLRLAAGYPPITLVAEPPQR